MSERPGGHDAPEDPGSPENDDVGDAADAADAAAAGAAERRRRRDRVFGAVLDDTTRDERSPEEGRGDRTRDDWLRRNVPPHHG